MNIAQSAAPDTASGPLNGIRVLDITTVVLGPIATQVLGDYGADVVKIESIDGDLMRANGTSLHSGMSSIFMALNRNKRSLALNLKHEAGRRIFLELVATADVIVHNMRVPAIERLGLGYDIVREIKPDIVYCAATGFGQDGPHRVKPAFDDIIQAACGLASLLGQSTGEPGYVPSLIADKTAGMAVANAVMAALVHRSRTGQGQYVEVPMFETLVEFTLAEHLGGLAFEPPLGPAGYGRIISGGRKPTPTADGHAAMLPYSPAQWIALFTHLGRLDLVEHYDIKDRQKLNAVVRDLYRELNQLTPSKTTAEWMAICESLDIPATPIYGIDELPEHPHLKAVRMMQSMDHPSEGRVNYIRPAVRFATTPASLRLPAPLLGEHTAGILAELGYNAGDIESLVARGTTAGPV